MRARSELRSRLAAVVTLGVIVGVIAGVAVAAAAGARRTDTDYPRLVRAERAMDVVVDVSGRDPSDVGDVVRRVQALPQVVDSARVTQVQGQIRIPGRRRAADAFLVTSPDGRFGTAV